MRIYTVLLVGGELDGEIDFLVQDGNGRIELEDRPESRLQAPTDAVARVTRSTICTSDLHIIHGAVPRA